MPSTFRAPSVDRLSTFFGNSDRKSTSYERNDVSARPAAPAGSRRRSSSINRLTAFLLNSGSKNNSMEESAPDDSPQDQQIRGRPPSRRLSKSRPPSLTRSPISDFSSSRSSAYPPSSFRMPPERRMSTNSILDTLEPPQPTFVDDTISRSTSPSTGWRPRSRAGSTSRPASRMSIMPSSTPVSRPVSPGLGLEEDVAKKSKRRSIFFGGSRNKVKTRQDTRPPAWVAGSGLNPENVPYDLTSLLGAQHVPELWDERGDTLVYLFPRTSDKGPSFKIRSSIFASSRLLTHLAYDGRPRRNPEATRKRISRPPQLGKLDFGTSTLQTPPHTPKLGSSDSPKSVASITGHATADTEHYTEDFPEQNSLYLPVSLSTDGALMSPHDEELPLTQEDVDTLITIRNLFAFLVGGALVATPRRSSIFGIFISIAKLLDGYQFANMDSTTFGEVASSSFDCYVDELDLADVRVSCDKIIEALVLGEKMKSTLLYDEAFTHYVGRYEEIQEVAKEPSRLAKLSLISRSTKLRAERAYIDLKQRKETANIRLAEFEFPSLLDDQRIKPLRDGFLSARRHVMSYYKTKYGSWPPKADWKKNELRTSGLNRIVLKELYQDFADMYDLYVDRTSVTTLAINQAVADDGIDRADEPMGKRLRGLFDDYNRSLPPVMPPIPFDIPLLPSLARRRAEYDQDVKQDVKSRNKKLKDEDVLAVLGASRNADTRPSLSPFLAAICKFERKEARGKSIKDLVNLRAGIWLFMYVIIQALPMLAIDAPGVRFHEGIEYFLCMPPRKGVPWATDAEGTGRARHSMAWYGIAGGSGMVELPSDLIEHGVEGIYRRSHCWLMAQKWSEAALAKIQGTPEVADVNVDQEWHDQSDRSTQSSRGTRPSYHDFPLPPPPVLRETVTGMPIVVPTAALMTPLASPTTSQHSSPPVLGRTSTSNSLQSSSAQRMSSPAEPKRRTRKDAMRESVFALGLEELPMPPNLVSPISSSRRESPIRPGLGSPSHSAAPALTRKTSMTFDDIIAGMEGDKKKKGKKTKSSK